MNIESIKSSLSEHISMNPNEKPNTIVENVG